MTSVSLEPKLGATVPTNSAANGSSQEIGVEVGFAAIMAELSCRHAPSGDEADKLRDLLTAVLDATKDLTSMPQGNGQVLEGFLGRQGGDPEAPSGSPGALAAIFNEFGLFGVENSGRSAAVGAGQPTPEGMAPTLAARSAVVSPSGLGDEAAEENRAKLHADQATFWSGPDYEFLNSTAPQASAATGHSRNVASPTAILPPNIGSSMAPQPAAATGAEIAEDVAGDQAAPEHRLSDTSAADFATRLSLALAEEGASLVARLDRLSREERLRFRHEAERLLLAYGFVRSEIRINGAVDRGA